MDTSSISADLRPYAAVADFIAASFGSDCEAILHDLRQPHHSVVYIANNQVTQRSVGESFRHIVSVALASAPGSDTVLDPYFFRQGDKLIRMSTLLIRDASGSVIGALCINYDTTRAAALAGWVRGFLPEAAAPAPQPADNAGDKSDDKRSVTDMVYTVIDRIVAEEAGSGPLTRPRRLALLRFMEARDVFQMKGAIEHAAERLGVSKVTVYSDLDEVRGRRTRRQG